MVSPKGEPGIFRKLGGREIRVPCWNEISENQNNGQSAHALRQDLGQPRRRPPGGRHLRPLYRPPPGPRGDQPAGLRGAAAGRPQGPPPRGHAGRRRPQRADRATAARASPTRKAASRSRRWSRTRATSACPTIAHGRHPPGHRPHHRAGAGPDPAGHDHRLRRQPHRDPRRLRRARLRHRHLRGRACAGDPDAAAEAGQEHAHHGRRRPAGRRAPPRT